MVKDGRTRLKSNQKGVIPLNDWFIKVQEGLVKDKLTMIKFLNQDIAFNLQLKEKNENLKTIWMLEHFIKTNQEHIRVLGDSIQFNRGLIDERREELRLRDHLKHRDEIGAGRAEGSGSKVIKQPSVIGSGY